MTLFDVGGRAGRREYRQTIEKDGALERRFQLLRIEEPSPEEAVAILTALRERMEAHHEVKLEDDALRAAVEWSVRYLPDFRLPDKALDLVDQACAAARFRTLTPQGSGDRMSPRRTGTASSSHDCQLSDAIRTHPYSVVLFDEIEKAHPEVLDLFLQIFDAGTLTDAQGRKCDFREAVILFGRNLVRVGVRDGGILLDFAFG